VSTYTPSADLSQFHAAFFIESREGLDVMESGLLDMENGVPVSERIDAVFRAAHSIKGSAATFGFEEIAALTHVMETVLDELRAGKRALDANASDTLLASLDILRALLAGTEHGTPVDQAAAEAMIARLNALSAAPKTDTTVPTPVAAASGWQIEFIPAPSMFMRGNDPLRLLRELDTLGEVQVQPRFDKLPALPELDPHLACLGWSLTVHGKIERSAIEEIFAWVMDDCELDIQPLIPVANAPAEPGFIERRSFVERRKSPGTEASETSIRVSVEKVDALIDLVGELIITQAMLKQVGHDLDPAIAERLSTGLDLLERNTRDLQDAVIGVRMLPIDAVFRRFPRLIRDLTGKLGKKVQLRTLGEGTELDKNLIETITDPLIHLVRNAIDHGLELPAERTAAGKPETGTLTLSASQQGGHIVIDVIDDGRGLNRDKILAKALERGLALPDNPTDAQVFELIFAPGFSTNDTVTDLSGRGVGMDVVRRNIQALGGSVQIHSALGEGTRIAIRLPLTLTILDGMHVLIDGQTLILPLTNVIEALQPEAADIRTLPGQGRVLQVRGEVLPLVHFNAQAAPREVPLVVVVEGNGRKLALEVDALVGQQQVVVKNLETHYRHIDGISGATILGDGQVALIIDVGDLIRARCGAQT